MPKQTKKKHPKNDGYGIGVEGVDSPRVKVNPNDEDVVIESSADETPQQTVVSSTAPAMTADELKRMFESVLEANLAPIKTQMATMDARLHEQENKLKRLENMVTASGIKEQHVQSRNIVDVALDSTFGTVGKVLHGLIDTTAFVASSVVDLATLGRAKSSTTLVK